MVPVAREEPAARPAECEVAYLAYHDAITGLPGRRLLEAHLSLAVDQAARDGHGVALLFVDLDHFRLVNESLGRDAGDLLLRQAGERLLGVVRHGDRLARQDSDEFLLMVPAIAPGGPDAGLERRVGEVLATCAERVLAALRRPFAVGGTVLHLGASVGAATFPFDGTDAATLTARADAAAYAARHAGGGWRRFDLDRLGALERRSPAARMRHGLVRGEFALDYAPVAELATGRVLGVEALPRWEDPARGHVVAAELLAEAEHAGVAGALGDWALAALCEQAATWEAEEVAPDLHLAVSPAGLRRPGFALELVRALERHGLDPARVVLGLQEPGWALEASRAVLAELRRAGVRVALDDFGTGAASLVGLHDLPVDVIKLAPAFLGDVPGSSQAEAVLSAVCALAAAGGADVVAKGVDTEGQRRFLSGLGVRAGQGHHLACPGPAEAIGARLAAATRVAV